MLHTVCFNPLMHSLSHSFNFFLTLSCVPHYRYLFVSLILPPSFSLSPCLLSPLSQSLSLSLSLSLLSPSLLSPLSFSLSLSLHPPTKRLLRISHMLVCILGYTLLLGHVMIKLFVTWRECINLSHAVKDTGDFLTYEQHVSHWYEHTPSPSASPTPSPTSAQVQPQLQPQPQPKPQSQPQPQSHTQSLLFLS